MIGTIERSTLSTSLTDPFHQVQLPSEKLFIRISICLGAIPEQDVIVQIWVLLLGGFGVSYGLDVWTKHDFPIVLCLTIFGALISYIYSAPPLKLKQSGWIGNYALGSSYIALPWWAGQVNSIVYILKFDLIFRLCLEH